MNLKLLSAGYFGISVNILEFCFGSSLILLSLDPFRWDQSSL